MIQTCTQCVLDTTVPNLTFDAEGICSMCKERDKFMIKDFEPSYNLDNLMQLLDRIRIDGKGNEYDCLIGPSGGVDSSYVAWLVTRKMGLRPLAVHLSNGLDSPEGQHNVNAIIRKLDIPYKETILDPEEFRGIETAYFNASVLGIDNPSDHAIIATLWHMAYKHNIKYIISGHNYATESMIPTGWAYDALDHVNIRDICSKFGAEIISMPMITYSQIFRYQMKGIQFIRLLNYVNYNKAEAKRLLVRELDWQDYGGKHCENILTRFAQSYMLPVKFNIDKRKYHLSSLIRSGQMTREQALKELELPPYEYEKFVKDKATILSFFEMSEQEFDRIMLLPIRKHIEFKCGNALKPYAWLPMPIRTIARRIVRL